MHSKTWRSAAAIAAAALSALLFCSGSGLHPVPWCTWLAPLPVLALAPRVGAGTAFAAGTAAWLGGTAPLWDYALNSIELPLPVVAVSFVGTASLFGLASVAFRALTSRGRPLSAALVVPAAWVTVEYALSVITPHGAWSSLAYTQADVLPVLQTASAAGVWGITFLLMAVPSGIAALLAPAAAGRLRLVAVLGSVLAVALGYGGWQLRTPPPAQRDTVALLATDHPNDLIRLGTPQGRDLVRRYTARIEALAAAGARVVVTPEKTFLADGADLRTLAAPLSAITARHRVDVIAGLVVSRGGELYNVALDFPAGGGAPVEYVKHHLIPGLEDGLRTGTRPAFVPGKPWGLIICKDLDYPGLVRDYRNRGATALYAPAWDFDRDGWLHSRMAVTRGVESGLSVARAPRAGLLVLSDPQGRIVAEAPTADTPFASVTAALPAPAAPTLYARWGDWAAWSCAVLLLLLLGALLRRPATPSSGHGRPVAGSTAARNRSPLPSAAPPVGAP
ncbi:MULTISPECIES: nitrilase-related carbon-nitrogen hydrolase [Streptosporangium]|uniref:Apolipoprotein N-acyltransferase n=1 Tax=Streptosporangium brasiliense TaxID=47480 RepID=A0ABT9R9S0_9ACTN|nr:nitrilase-related carbon-nitrogen hydrolase [Streptosporangium brasiliense]MDP9865994.1 apolipoprotein N-acyltransferase [Streptosporangium brasiliense]